MPKKFQFELVSGLPEDYGVYLFFLEDGSIKEGYFSSFSYPYNQKDVRVSNCCDQQFDYVKVLGWLKAIEDA